MERSVMVAVSIFTPSGRLATAADELQQATFEQLCSARSVMATRGTDTVRALRMLRRRGLWALCTARGAFGRDGVSAAGGGSS